MDDAKTHTRRQILKAAAGILEREGAQAVSTRSVAAAAGIRAASLYQLFGDKDALLAALAMHGFDLYLAEKHELAHTDDSVDDMRRGWDMHVDFGLRHPAFYVLMFGTDRPGRRPPAAQEAHDLLLKFLDRAAAVGRLRVPTLIAARLLHAAVTGVTLSLIGAPAEDREPEISTRMRDTLIDSLTTDPPPVTDTGLASRALALDAALTAAEGAPLPLRPTETALLRDWLHQLAR
ncbi:transcriptional regulator, TetR family [Streptosporangium subroseum]|uniref:Transcriptional regulator, TetR family n=1 Tax=Streptosporangium subroseum TaxID=106412 RepID=A0A239NNC1_9ACTN|nr:TetR/AcrR family transcriptional regulator [Streptosporangium subroseum]SNT55589.1 transcriptional regulator, TetR family [Streptosporangium subroseum]